MPTFITPNPITTSGITNSTWTQVNLNAYGVPSGASGVMLNFVMPLGHSGATMARMHGSTDSFVTGNQQGSTQFFLPIGVDGSQNIDLYLQDHNCAVYVVGYFGSEATFFTNATTLANLSTSYTNYNLASSCPGGVAAFLFVDSAYNCAFRQNGSSDAFTNANETTSRKGYIVGLDSSQLMQGKGGSSLVPHLNGYMTSGVVWNTNAIARTPGTSGSFQSLATESGAIGYAYQFNDPNAVGYTYSVREVGYSSYAPAATPIGGGTAQNVAGDPAETNISNTALTVFELGYFTSGSAGAQLLPPMSAGQQQCLMVQ